MNLLRRIVDKELLDKLGMPDAEVIHGEIKPTAISPSIPGCPEEFPEAHCVELDLENKTATFESLPGEDR